MFRTEDSYFLPCSSFVWDMASVPEVQGRMFSQELRIALVGFFLCLSSSLQETVSLSFATFINLLIYVIMRKLPMSLQGCYTSNLCYTHGVITWIICTRLEIQASWWWYRICGMRVLYAFQNFFQCSSLFILACP